MSETIKLYNLYVDKGEENNIAEKNPEIAGKIMAYLDAARSESKYWKP